LLIEFGWNFLNSNRQKTHKMRDNHEQPFGKNCKVHAKIAQDRRSDRRSNRIASNKIRQKNGKTPCWSIQSKIGTKSICRRHINTIANINLFLGKPPFTDAPDDSKTVP
jgi:hypothetical protein